MEYAYYSDESCSISSGLALRSSSDLSQIAMVSRKTDALLMAARLPSVLALHLVTALMLMHRHSFKALDMLLP
jgi:hypothetical protein